MTTLTLGVGEPFSSPAFNSNFVVFSSDSGECVPETDAKEHIRRACRYARQFGVYLVPERFMLMGYQSLCLISPEGKVLGAQRATHLRRGGQAGKRAVSLEVIPTEFGGIFLSVDVDIFRPQIPRIAHTMGAHFIIASQQIRTSDYSTRRVLSGVWSAAQGNPMYVVGVCNQFNCVCAPRELTARADGFLVPPNLKMPMTAQLDAHRLGTLALRPLLSRRFYALHRNDLTGTGSSPPQDSAPARQKQPD